MAKISKEAERRGLDFGLVRQSGIHQLWSCGASQFMVIQQAKMPEAIAQRVITLLESEFGKDWWGCGST